jgi:cell division septation protein DedD
MLAAAVLGGYLYGLREAEKRDGPSALSEDVSVPVPVPSPPEEDARAPVTFYTVLTEPRKETPFPPKPLKDKPPQAPPAKAGVDDPETGGSLILQVASYQTKEAAGKLLEKLSAEGYSGTIQVADLGERGTWYRVRIGPYRSEKDAERVLQNLRNERKLKGYIVR